MRNQIISNPRDTYFPDTQADMNPQFPEVTKYLKNCRLFNELTGKQIEKLAGVFTVHDYEAGDFIFKQGELGDRIHIIARGLVNLERHIKMGDREASVSVSFLGPCRILGCWACLLGKSRHHTESAVCHKQTRTITATGSDLRVLFETDHPITEKLLTELCFMLGDKVHGIYGAMESL